MIPPSINRPNEPIAVIGTGLRFPGGVNDPTQLWDLLQHPRDVQTVIPADRFSIDGFYQPSHDNQGSSHTRHGYFLSGDHRQFDAEFFGIIPVEASSMDPQQRLLLEVVYESIEAAGLDMKTLQGSPTAVYVGLMAVDYNDMLNRDPSDFPPYVAAGTSRSMFSNRISHFFDWRGPSMTIDTACSSSLVAIHLAIQSLRAGDCELAIAAGANLMLGPEQFIVGSSMKMLSPDGRSFWCDDRANGYARGEGFASIVLKTLSAAIADGDDIECVIAETGLNQDGRTQGLTVPSADAQATLIQTTYRKAGLDLTKPSDRPQYFEAHGTGTPTGDPLEVKAIHDAFFANTQPDDSKEQLYCGSVKTIIGHTEGTAGLAGLIKTSLALRHGIIPPNLLFENLSPRVKPFFDNLKIPTTAESWPVLPPGVIRRASVNSFGFGGTNAHCILESYDSAAREQPIDCVTNLPFVFSAPSEKALVAILKSYLKYLNEEPAVELRALSHTLCTRRTAFPVRVAFSANSMKDLHTKLNSIANQEGAKPFLTAPVSALRPRILGVFTGQGAQWAGMASRLMEFSGTAALIDELERSLAELPDPPSWSLKAELSKEKSHSRITETAITQPACTAVQILLVEMLRAAGVRFSAVVGHSSGEIAAAYTAGYLSAQDAIRVAYYRGRHVPLIGGRNGERGSMIAIGASYEEAQNLCNQDELRGRICIAASNSASSITLSGDTSAIEEVQTMFKASNRFTRLLRVDNAYHSHHMIRCSEAITASYRACKIKSRRPTIPDCLWVSSVYHRDIALVTDSLDGHYWHSNTIGEVLFSQALEHALQQPHFDLAVEIGAHPALKGPALQVIEDTVGYTIPYTGMLARGVEDDEAFANSLGYIWASLARNTVDFAGYDQFMNATESPTLLKGLPTYPWNHERAFWHESRVSRAFRGRSGRHKLLGLKNVDYSEDQISWKHSLIPDRMSWLQDHRIQGQMIFPGAAYIVSAFEAARQVTGEQSVRAIELTDFVFGQPLVFATGDTRIEVLVSLRGVRRRDSKTTADFTYHSIANETSGSMTLNAHCQVTIDRGHQDGATMQPFPEATQFGMQEVGSDRIYESFAKHGYHYTGPFRSLTSVSRRLGVASGLVQMPGPTHKMETLMHPATLDAAMHSIMVAHSYPGDGRLSTPRIPTEVSKISLDLLAALRSSSQQHLKFVSIDVDNVNRKEGRVELSSVDGADSILQIEGLRTKPMVPATPANDVRMFSETVWGPGYPLLRDGHNGFNTSRDVVDVMTSAAEELTHRYPGMHILGQVRISDISHIANKILSINRADPEHVLRFLSGLDNAFASYTHTDVSEECLDLGRTVLDSLDDKITYRKTSPDTDVSDQGFTARSADLVVTFSMPSTLLELQHTLRDVGYLLRPGGYFLCPQPIDPDLLIRDPSSEIVVAPDVCGGPAHPSLQQGILSQRKQMLELHDLADFDSLLQTRNSISHNGQDCVTLMQAIDNRVQYLRDPLNQVARHPQIMAGDITLIGGDTTATSACAGQIEAILNACGGNVVRAQSISSLLDTEARFGGSVLVLQDCDKPIFEDFDQNMLAGLKNIFAASRNVLWVTFGYKRNAPNARMLVAFARCLAQEMEHVRLQIVDFTSPDTLEASLISQVFLRLLGTTIWEDQGRLHDILWSAEPEISYEEGDMFIPRVKPCKTLNDRYNSSRRPVTRDVALADEMVALSPVDDTYVLKASIGASQASLRNNHVTIHVTHSFLKAVKIERSGFFYLLLGTDVAGNEQVIALSSTLSSRVDVPRELVRSCPLPKEKNVEHLHAVFYGLVSFAILRGLTSDDAVLVLEPDSSIATILPAFAKANCVRVLFSVAREDQNLDSQPPRRALGSEISDALHDINLARVVCWKDDVSTASIRSEIPFGLACDEMSAYVAEKGSPVSCMSIARASLTLDRVHDRLSSTISTNACEVTKCISLSDVAGTFIAVDPMTMLEWKAKSKVQVCIEPIDHGVLFQCDRTYWLVGLTGDLGLSLCLWMITKGARFIAISSRHPKVDPAWITHFRSLGATVEVLTCDVTEYESIEATLGSIEVSMPPIAGVCHGAMVLQDALFHDLDPARMEQVLKPKVNGAVNLDRVFRKHSLDFFIMLSSVAAITGNPGQSVYAAANGFLAGLSAQRRARGDCASTINMGAILGAGTTRALTTAQQISLQKAGVMWTSEQDFHTAFAEAVVANRSCSDSNGEFTTGVRICNVDEEFKPKHASSPIFSHMLLRTNILAQSNAFAPAAETVRARLLQATDEKMLLQILAESLTSKLRKALQMSPGSTVIDETAESLGIDSLIAIEIRSWLLKELSVDLPLLIVIGGNNMRQVLEACRARLDPAMTPLLDAESGQTTTSEVWQLQDDSKVLVSSQEEIPVISAHTNVHPAGTNNPKIVEIVATLVENPAAPVQERRTLVTANTRPHDAELASRPDITGTEQMSPEDVLENGCITQVD
ncbi:ketoacyl-synt-domain-containing protein [Didymella exigua CBS 183.55]|uniref:Ketoacyl-synt-domain-containing protein n=1 Tax=Didymella exigua CBS 183.55 TaxID=1150837 RepID=A0A6A5RT75_9PLEO|nr:ketoacyl-synt-domain-containing protein [Didymella exigua CBS 183.55]KAF1930198.1 ketoacyl-synt-domain-containing protein [Didymella exigua CBS 183.55]